MTTCPAADLPPHSEVDHRGSTWTKVTDGFWLSGHGERRTDADMDEALADGGTVTVVPAGQGHSPDGTEPHR